MTSDKPLYKLTQIVWYVFYIIEALLLLRFVLRLLGANPEAAFTQFVYGLSFVLVAPFRLVFSAGELGVSTIEWGTLLALIVYFFVAQAVVKLLSMGRSVSEYEADQGLKEQEAE